MNREADPSPIPEQVLEMLRVRLLSFASSRGVGDRAHDVVQDTLLLLLTKYSHVRTEADLVPLSFKICGYKIKETVRPPGGKSHDPLEEDMPLAAGGIAADQAMEWKARREQLFKAITTLELRCRQLFRLRLQGRKTEQIATLMSTPEVRVEPSTVYVWLHRCRKALFKKLREQPS